MNKNSFLVAVVFLVFISIPINSCKKSDPVREINEDGEYYRLVEAHAPIHGEDNWKEVVTYNSNRVEQIVDYQIDGQGEWKEGTKYEMQYPSPYISIMTQYNMEHNEWKPWSREIFTYENDHLIEYQDQHYADGYWKESGKEIYTYDNGLLQQIAGFNLDENIWIERARFIYEYTDNRLIQVSGMFLEEDIWVESYLIDYQYIGDELRQAIWTLYDYIPGEWYPFGKYEIEYENGKVVIERVYLYDTSNLIWVHRGTISYQYDSHGNLILTDLYSHISGNNSLAHYTYEPGKGNYRPLHEVKASLYFNIWKPFPTKAANRGVSRAKGFGGMMLKN